MHFIRVLTLFICCLISGTLGLIILDMKSLGVIMTRIGIIPLFFSLMFFSLMFIVELVINVDNRKRLKQ